MTLRRDHPRVCGEKLSDTDVEKVEVGSPPRVRGKVLDVASITPGCGITPACAGKRQLPYVRFA